MLNLTPRLYATQLEIWRPIPEYEGIYAVSSLGRIMRTASGSSTRIGRILGGYFIKDGYLRVSLCQKNKKFKGFLIHRLVAMAFIIKPRGALLEVNHINSNRTDNRAANLEWVTHRENIIHSFKFGNNNHKGEKNSHATLNWESVREIRVLYASGIPQPILAEKYGVKRSCISKITTQRSWKE